MEKILKKKIKKKTNPAFQTYEKLERAWKSIKWMLDGK